MSIFNFDIKKWIYNVLPTFLRKQNLTDFLEALLSPLKRLFDLLVSFRNGNLYRLDITSQVCKLEKMLNDRYDPEQRRITITDGEFVPEEFIYKSVEKRDISVYLNSENDNVPVYKFIEFGSKYSDFIVNVPGSVAFDLSEMTALIHMYKLASKIFTIKII